MLKFNTSVLFLKLFTITVFILGISSFLSYGRGHVFNVSFVLELLIICTALVSLLRVRLNINNALISGSLFLYIFLSFVFSVLINGDNVVDFLIVYKAYVYLFFLYLIGSSSHFLDERVFFRYFEIIFYALVGLMLIKYSSSYFLSLNLRPFLIRENNFELMLLSLLLYLKYIAYRRLNLTDFALVSSIFLMSGSRSAIVMLLIVVLGILINERNVRGMLVSTLAVFVAVFSVFWIFISRSPNFDLQKIDRVAFFNIFRFEYSQFSLTEVLLGRARISPLDESSCQMLIHFDSLFSRGADGGCYSVVFHSYILRALYDHGLILFVVFLSLFIYFMRRLGFNYLQVGVVSLVVFINGMSVSSFNSYFFPLAIMFFIVYSNTVRPSDSKGIS